MKAPSFFIRALFVVGSLAPAITGRAVERPNIVFILVDDLGATDLSCFGSPFYQTPNIDRLAHDGVKFTHAYSACTVCSPTRASIISGRYPAELHLTDWIAGHNRPKARLRIPDWSKNLTHDVPTLPQAMHAAGYTTAAIGKWHLGEDRPDAYGFDVAIADNGKGQPATYFSPYKNPNLADGPAGEFLSDRLTTEAEKFIEQNKEHPFFLYFAHYAVHTPLMGKADVIAKYKDRASANDPQHNATYAALVESVDDSVGHLRAKLDELKLTDRTVVIFASDNGGLRLNDVTSNLGLRAGKGSAYEGGVRTPAIVFVPGVTQAGTVNATPIISMDWTATILDLAGAKPLDQQRGVSLKPVLGGGEIAPRPLFWHYPHYHPGGATPYSAVLDDSWRLVEFFEDNHVELYHLSDDPLEAHDLAATQSGKAAELKAKLHAWRESMGAQLPTLNPDYDPNAPLQVPKKKAAPEQ
ncbi:MAG: sulfatase [Chthoniobacter sp.]